MTPDLITRLEAAAEGSRELDRGVAFAVKLPFPSWASFNEHAARHDYGTSFIAHGPWIMERIPPLTTSIDAAVALFAERLPGWAWRISAYVNSRPEALIWQAGKEAPQRVAAATPALALCIALLRALTPTKEGSEDA